jgi:hypothetical protein
MPQQGRAWGADGHMIICDIAYHELTPKARAKVNHLLAQDPEFHTFAAACVWADEVANSTRPETKPWHFINLPKDAARVSPGECPKFKGCILSAIALHKSILANPDATDAQKLEALKYLGHWIGDVHQPLHISFKEDRGGNFIPVRWRYFTDTNLHKIWDSVIIVDEEHRSHHRRKALSARLEAQVTPAERQSWIRGTTLDWANETFKITRAAATDYVTARPNELLELGAPYYQTNLPVINRQLERAGVRLGALLNKILGN